jgi:hypothetical protein
MPAYANLRSNALLTFDGSLGHVAEVLSGNYYQTLATGSPHQIWSSAMVISSLLTGMFGLDSDARANHLSFNPHVPADWTSFGLQRVKAGSCMLNLSYGKSAISHSSETLTLEVERTAGSGCSVDFSPALSLRTQIVAAELNGHPVPFHLNANTVDQHVSVHIVQAEMADRPATLTLRLRNDFGLSQNFELPHLGNTNQGLRIVSQAWSTDRNTLTLETASGSSGTFDLGIWNPEQIVSIDGAELVHNQISRTDGESTRLRITMHAEPGTGYPHQRVVLHFKDQTDNKKGADVSGSHHHVH